MVHDRHSPVHALSDADADLVVVGSRGLHGLRALGSVSERVAHRARASVLVVRERTGPARRVSPGREPMRVSAHDSAKGFALRLVPGEEFGRYRIEAEIGRGGQAVVYRATQLDLDRQVALKVFDEGYLNRGGALERFRREAIAAGRLEHPRIVPVYDAGETDGRAFMSMRLIPGDSLAERIARNGPLPPAEALAVLSDIGEAIDFAHARGTVHRDVKTANILLDPEGASYLSDFGLVRLDDMPGLTRRGRLAGDGRVRQPGAGGGRARHARIGPLLARGGRLRDAHGTAALRAPRAERRAAGPRPRPGAGRLRHRARAPGGR